MSYLIDTNVISELRKGKRCDARVAAWFSGIEDDDIFLSVLTIGELRQRIERIKRRQSKKAVELDSWLHTMLEAYEDRILPIDRSVAEEWGRMNFPDPLPAIDGLLAATAKIYGLCFVTRNTKDIARTGVTCLNPFS